MKQLLNGINKQNLNELAHYLVIYFPYDEEICSYTSPFEGEIYGTEYPLVAKGMWSGVIELKKHKLLNWKPEYGNLYLQAKVRDSGTYFLLDKDRKAISKIAGYVPNGLIPEPDDCGDYIRLKINSDGTIENWSAPPDFKNFIDEAEVVGNIDTKVEEFPIMETKVEFTYGQLMAKLLQLPKFLQLEIGKALIANASEEFIEE